MAATSGVGSTTDTPPIEFSEKKGYQSLTTEDFVQLLVATSVLESSSAPLTSVPTPLPGAVM